MRLTTLYRVPRTTLSAIEPDQDYLEQFPFLEIEGVDSGYWQLLATKLELGEVVEAGDPLAFDEAGGLAMLEWSPAFASRFCAAPKGLVEAAVHALDQEAAYPGLDIAIIQDAVHPLRQFLAETDCNHDALVEYATF